MCTNYGRGRGQRDSSRSSNTTLPQGKSRKEDQDSIGFTFKRRVSRRPAGSEAEADLVTARCPTHVTSGGRRLPRTPRFLSTEERVEPPERSSNEQCAIAKRRLRGSPQHIQRFYCLKASAREDGAPSPGVQRLLSGQSGLPRDSQVL